jgi:hypothetical protein
MYLNCQGNTTRAPKLSYWRTRLPSTRVIAWRMLSWRAMKWRLGLPPFKGRDRVYLGLRKWLTDPRHTIVARASRGFRMKLDLGDEIDAQVYLYGCFDPRTSAIASSVVSPGDTVLDAGANIGYLS